MFKLFSVAGSFVRGLSAQQLKRYGVILLFGALAIWIVYMLHQNSQIKHELRETQESYKSAQQSLEIAQAQGAINQAIRTDLQQQVAQRTKQLEKTETKLNEDLKELEDRYEDLLGGNIASTADLLSQGSEQGADDNTQQQETCYVKVERLHRSAAERTAERMWSFYNDQVPNSNNSSRQ